MPTITTYEDVVASARQSGERLVLVERDGSRATVTMHDPERLNALSAVLTIQLHDALRELAAEPDLRTIVLTGSDPAFSAGGDLRLMTEAAHPMVDESPEGAADVWRWIRNQFGGVAKLITRTDKAFVAAVTGAAAGVGLAFALACDVLLLSERARIVPAFGKIGLIPEVGTSWLLTRKLGYQGAFAFYTSGEHVDAQTAKELGLVNEVVAHDRLLPRAHEWCDRLAALPPYAPQMAKTLLRQAASMTWEQALTAEEFAEPTCFTTAEFSGAVNAMLAAR